MKVPPTQSPSVQSSIHPSPCWFSRCFSIGCMSVEFDAWPLVISSYALPLLHTVLCGQEDLSGPFLLFHISAGVMVISTAACHCVVSSSKETLIFIWCFQHQCFPHHAVLFKLFFLTRSPLKQSLSLSNRLTGAF